MSNNQKYSKARLIMQHITENSSSNPPENISSWIGDIGSNIDTMLLLVNNKSVSEDLIANKTIQNLFDTGIVLLITEEVLSKQSLEEIVNNKLFLHINSIPKSEENQKKLKELINSVLIHKSIQINGSKIPTQAKIIVTINEPHPFFKDFLEVSTTLFIDSKDNIFTKFQITSMTPLYQAIESSLDIYADEIRVMPKAQLDIRINENNRYLESLIETSTDKDTITENGIQILDPFNNSFNELVQMNNRIHSLILGASGAGKTEQIKTMIYCDILRKDGSVIIIDPHGDFAKDILKFPIDKDRIVFIDPSLKENMTPTMNIFENENTISEQDIKLKANIIISVVKVINDEEKFSSSMEEMLYHCICILIRKGNSSFKELLLFMNDNKNKNLVELGLQSPNELDSEYFEDFFNNSSSKQTKNALRRRLKKLLSDHYFSNLVNGESTFNIEELMNMKGKVIIINVNKHNMPEHYGYFSRFIIEIIQKVAFNRAKIPKEDRIPTYCYIDEGQNFITSKIEEVLTEVRKYNLRMNFSFQSISQIKNKTTKNIIVSNTNTKFLGKDDYGVSDILKKVLDNEAIAKIPNLSVGQFYLKANNKDLLLVQNSNKLLDGNIDISKQELEDLEQEQLIYYRPIQTLKNSQPTEKELIQMLNQFKNDVKSVLSSQKPIESSCLIKLKDNAPAKFKEIKSDIEYFDSNKGIIRPRIRQQEINTVFQLSFGFNTSISNRKFIPQLKNEDENDMFNQTDSGTRSLEFTDNGKTQTEQYYYLQW